MSTTRACACGLRTNAAAERVLAEVVEEVRAAGDQLGVLDPLHRLAEQLRGHGSARPASRVISAARSTEATMFW